MRVTTLGTAHGNPTYCRFNSSTLVEAGGALYLVDAGAPVHALLIRAQKDWQGIRAAFITHMHEDHVAGLPSLIKMLLKYPRDGMDFRAFLPEPRALPALEDWLRAMRLPWPSPRIALAATREGEIYRDDVAAVQAVGTRHIGEKADSPISFAYVLQAEGKRTVFTGDLAGDYSDFPAVARSEPCDLVVSEATHVRVPETLSVLRSCPIGRLVLSHVGDPWHGPGEDQLLAAMSSLPFPVHVAHDGDCFDL